MLFVKNSRYSRYKLKILDFRWVELTKLHIPWLPLCEISPAFKDRSLCPVVAEFCRNNKGKVDTRLKNSMHVDLLKTYMKDGENIFVPEVFSKTRYYLMHKKYREIGVNPEIRTDKWILSKIKKLIIIFLTIKREGYYYEFHGDKSYISILKEPMAKLRYGDDSRKIVDGYELWAVFSIAASCGGIKPYIFHI